MTQLGTPPAAGPPPAPAAGAGVTLAAVLDAVKVVAAVSLALFSLYSAIFGVFQDMVQKRLGTETEV